MKIAVVYWSGTGNTEAMAQSVAAGAQSKGAQADLLTADVFGPASIPDYDAFAFGCPAMGDEVLEEGDFEPMFSACENELAGKKVVLFGSYGWGDGAWMRDWEDRCRTAGIELAAESVICQDAPDADTVAACESAGAALV